MSADVVAEISAGEQVHHEVEILPILKGRLHVDEVALICLKCTCAYDRLTVNVHSLRIELIFFG